MLRGSATSFYEADGLGSITSLTNSAGTVAQSYTFDSFGNQTASSGSLTNPFQYTAREFDPETGVYYYRARYYDPTVARFLSEDGLRFRGGINFYSYAADSPLNYVDPSGFQPDNKKKWYDWRAWNWVPGVLPTKCSIWSHYCWQNIEEQRKALDQNPYTFTDDELNRNRGDEGQRQLHICTLGDDNCKKLLDQCGGPLLGLIFRTGAFPKPPGSLTGSE